MQSTPAVFSEQKYHRIAAMFEHAVELEWSGTHANGKDQA